MNSFISRRRGAIAAGLLAGALALSPVSRADEKNLPLDQVPKAVMDALKAKFPDLKPSKASIETEDGKEIIEVAFTARGGKYEVESTPRGNLLAIDRLIKASELPKAVSDVVKAKYPNAKLKSIEEVTKNDKVVFHEIDLVSDGKEVELQVDKTGKILNEEKKSAGEDKD